MERAVSLAGWLVAGLLHIFQFATQASAMTAPFRAVTFAGTEGVASTFVRITKCYTPPAPCTTATCSAIAPPNSIAMSVHSKHDAARIWLDAFDRALTDISTLHASVVCKLQVIRNAGRRTTTQGDTRVDATRMIEGAMEQIEELLKTYG